MTYEQRIYTRDEVIGLLAALFLMGIPEQALRIASVAAAIRWTEVLGVAGDRVLIEEGQNA